MHARKDLPSPSLLKLGKMSMRELEKVLMRGDTPDPDALAGWEYRGLNTPPFARLLGIKKFVKGFFHDDHGVRGYNLPVAQNAVGAPWVHKTRQPKRFGFYQVDFVDATARDNAYLHALLLDYGRVGGSRLDPTTRLRDYLVRVDRGSDDLLLGKAYLAVGPLRVPASYFLLERWRKIAP